MVCYVKLSVFEEVVSKIQLLEYLSLAVFFRFHHLYDTVLQKGLKVITWWQLCIVEAAHSFIPKKTRGWGSRGCGCLWVQQSNSVQRPAVPEAGLSPGLDPWLSNICIGTLGFFKQAFSINKKPVTDTGPSRFTCLWTLHVVLSQMSCATFIS